MEEEVSLKAYIHRVPSPGGGEGPLAGVRVSIKDLFGLEGAPTYAGSPRRLPPRWEREGPVVRRLKQLGAVITGKTHTVEFAFGGLGTNPHHGTPPNPHDPGRVPGGSSSGAGVSLHEDARIALGTDTAGSVRIPASMTGAVGLKTSQGRWSTEGIVPLSPSFDSVGLLCRDVADLAFAFHALDGSPPKEVGPMRLGVLQDRVWDDCDPGVAEQVEDLLRRSGAERVDVHLPEVEPALEWMQRGHLAAADLCAFLDRELVEWWDTLDPAVAARVEAGGRILGSEYRRRADHLSAIALSANARIRDLDALVCPTVPITPPLIDDLADPEVYRRDNMLALRNTCLANLLGMCALSVPAGTDKVGMPVGLQLIACHGRDARLVAMAGRLPITG